MSANEIGLPEALERAASALSRHADDVRPANGDPLALLSLLDAEAALDVLSWLLVHEPGAGDELVDAWVEAGGEAVAVLGRVDIEALPKAGRKILKRARHKLRSRGEALPEPPSRAVVAKLPTLDDDIEVALLSPLGPTGTRAAYLVEAHPSGGARLFMLGLDDEYGVLELEVFNAGRSKIKQFVRDQTRRRDYPVVAVPADSLRALVGRVAGRQAADRPLPRAFSEWRSRIAVAPDPAATPGALVRDALGAGSADDADALARVATRVREKELGPWPPGRDVLQEVAQKLDDASAGVVIVSDAAREEQVAGEVEAALERIFDAAFCERTAERLEEVAFHHWRRDEGDDARACLAAAAAFRERPPSEHPIARAMLEVVLAPVLEAIERKTGATETPEGDDSGLVKP